MKEHLMILLSARNALDPRYQRSRLPYSGDGLDSQQAQKIYAGSRVLRKGFRDCLETR